jgi:two-component sensor histidine kinase
MGLIINELITNSLKYAFKERKEGEISITATEDAQSMTIIVADNGAGMPHGITLENRTSLGLRLVNKLTGQLHGKVLIDNTRGTKFVFTFPKQEDMKSGADDILRLSTDTPPCTTNQQCIGI